MTALEFAIEMELEGQQYYLEQAKLNEMNSAKQVFLILAKDEAYHAKILKQKRNELPYTLEDSDSYSQLKNVFKDVSTVKSELCETPTQLEFYQSAVQLEKESIRLYTELLSEAEDANDRDLFHYLIEQEKLHLSILEHLATDLRHANEWVESAEFGLRNETY